MKTLATKKSKDKSTLAPGKDGKIRIRNRQELAEALEEVDEIQEKIVPMMNRVTELKKGATYYAAEKRVDVVQLKGRYWRLIERVSKGWDAKLVQKIVKGKKVKVDGEKKSLWNLITKRVPDPEKINDAINNGWLDEDEISEAFRETPQAPFLQRYDGKAD